MLWINYLDTGSERVHTSLEGSLRMEGSRDGGEEEERRDVEGGEWSQGKIRQHPSLCSQNAKKKQHTTIIRE